MKVIDIPVKSFTILLILCSQAFAQYSWPKSEIYKQNTIEKESGLLRSHLTGNFKKITDGRYFLKKSGKGDYSKFKDALWTLESETELRGGLLCPLYTICTIYDKDKKKIVTCKNEYDYKNGVIRITEKDADNATTKEIALPLKNRTTDYVSLIYFLKSFINDLIAGETVRFNFLSCEPGLYKLKARFIQEDTLLIGSQEIETVKVAITPDMGAFNIILDRFVPPTLLWYEKKEPHVWLKYEGLESGRNSTHIITIIEEIVPF